MSEPEEKGAASIWASRASADSKAFPTFAPRRARAGTLPSRLPSRVDTHPPSAHLGSLALISPDGNDIVQDNFPSSCSRTAVGQQPTAEDSFASVSTPNGFEKRRSPPLAPIPEPSALPTLVHPTHSALGATHGMQLGSPRSHSHSNSHGGSQSNSQNGSPTHSAGQSSNPSPAPSLSSLLDPPSSSISLAPPSNFGRARSGSLNSLAMRAQNSYFHYGSSIWGPGSRTPLHPVVASPSHHSHASNGSPSSTVCSSPASSAVSSYGAPVGGVPPAADVDPMILFSNEMNKANPNRMRSYTLDVESAIATDWTAQVAPRFAQRTRAQTLMPPTVSSLHPPQPIPPLARLPHNLLNDASAVPAPGSGTVQLSGQDLIVTGDLSPTPTPAICVSNLPAQATQLSLHSLFGHFGKIESVVVVPRRRCAYIVFASTIQAIEAQATANGAELYFGNGPSKVSFTYMTSPTSSTDSFTQQHSGQQSQQNPQAVPPASSATRHTSHVSQPVPRHYSPEARDSNAVATLPSPSTLSSSPAPVSVAYILQTLNADRSEITAGIEHLQRASVLVFDGPIKPLTEHLAIDPGSGDRTYNAAVLRDLRRRLETMLLKEVEEVALDMQRELPALASDYIGNTTVQLVFERSGPEIRDMMLRRLVDVFAATGTHKNGTWAVQKMIDLARGPRQFALVERAIRPHLVALLLDQFGNYVVQGCLKFGAPYSDFVYSGIASSLPKIAPNRFGARAVRAVLESEHTTAANQRLVATAIVQQIAALATNPNGCLLVSWLLDNFERSDPEMHLRTHALVAAQLVPQHLAAICSSKLGSGIVLKLASSPSSSSHRVFDALLEPLKDGLPSILVDVLDDITGQGASCVYRLMTTVFPPQSLERQVTINKVRMCLLRPGARIPNHRRLLEEVGLNMLHPEVKEGTGNSPHHESASPPREVPVIHSNKGVLTAPTVEQN